MNTFPILARSFCTHRENSAKINHVSYSFAMAGTFEQPRSAHEKPEAELTRKGCGWGRRGTHHRLPSPTRRSALRPESILGAMQQNDLLHCVQKQVAGPCLVPSPPKLGGPTNIFRKLPYKKHFYTLSINNYLPTFALLGAGKTHFRVRSVV